MTADRTDDFCKHILLVKERFTKGRPAKIVSGTSSSKATGAHKLAQWAAHTGSASVSESPTWRNIEHSRRKLQGGGSWGTTYQGNETRRYALSARCVWVALVVATVPFVVNAAPVDASALHCATNSCGLRAADSYPNYVIETLISLDAMYE